MRFGDFLRATVMLSAGAATLLATLTVIGLSREYDKALVLFSAGWWTGAVLIGVWIGRRAETSPPIARLLATARTQTSLPELRPGLTLVNRLWPLLLATLGAAVLSVFEPQVVVGRGRLRDHLGARLAPPGRRRGGDRGARRRALLRRQDVAAAADPARPHARLRRRLPHLPPVMTNVLLVSLGSTVGLREADAELASSLRRAGATVARHGSGAAA